MSVRSLNKVMLIGNLTRDPEIRYTNGGATVVSFGLATNKSWKNPEGEIQESTEFHNVVAWSKMAEICQQLLAKGMKVYIEGSLNTRSWEDDSGSTKYKTEVRVDEMILLDSKGKQGAGMEGQEAPARKEEPAQEKVEKKEEKAKEEEGDKGEDVLDDDLPF
jgi:single-strand DNA-binding protein